jgi:carboxymethylenebutenolidase
VAYYGGSVPKLIDKQPQCPVLFHWGDQDTNIPATEVAKVEAVHPGATSFHYSAGHGFNCDQRPSFHAEAATLARERTLAFLRERFR